MICTILAVSVEKTRKLLSQNPQATRNLLSTVVTKQFDRIFRFWLKLSPKCRRNIGFALLFVWAGKEIIHKVQIQARVSMYAKEIHNAQRQLIYLLNKNHVFTKLI